jgi:MFS family permease
MVIYLRRKLPESPRYLSQIVGDKEAALSAFESFTGNILDKQKPIPEGIKTNHGIKEFFSNKQYVLTLFGTAGSWFLLDWAYYGNTISTPIVMNAITDSSSLELKMIYSLLIFVIFALPGYILSIVFMDIIGRKYIQLMGFGIMAFSFLLLGTIPDIENNVTGFLILYGLSYLFTEFGPNTTTFVLPSELFPTEYRTTGHGFSAGIGKFGAFLGVLFFPITESFLGLNMTFVIVSIICFLGIITTSVLTEPKGKSLEDCSYSKIVGK